MPIIDCYGQLGPQPFPTKATRPEALEELMGRFGVDMTFVAATEALRGSMKAGNEWLAEQIRDRPKFRGYCVVNPLMLEASQAEMRKHLSKELFVGAIIHEGYIKRPLNSEAMRNLVKALLRYDRPLLLTHQRSARNQRPAGNGAGFHHAEVHHPADGGRTLADGHLASGENSQCLPGNRGHGDGLR